MIKRRIISALIAIGFGAPLVIFLGPYAIYFFTLLIAAGCLYEYFSMIMGKQYSKSIRLTGVLIGVLIIFFSIFFKFALVSALTIGLMFYSIYFLLRSKKYPNDLNPASGFKLGKIMSDLSLSLFGILYFSVFLAYFPMLRDTYDGLKWVITLMAVIWIGDTGAFFMGSKYGKTKLFNVVSPNKTIEGSLGGLLFSFIAVLLCKLIFFHGLDLIDCVNIGILGGAFGQIGDLIESMIKRSVSVKDSGAVMPGHGGFFDRFDALIFALPFFYFYAKFFF
ncbi:MAG: phosphatidate cytidylyltransferase [Proteobacteria bacterium]|nr:phosphatidate cytidylyltransferase [Pseudomonadota bacterium]